MVLISATRLKLRSLFYLPQFFWYNERAARQLEQATGFLGGHLLVDRHLVFWTTTAWESAAAMGAYRNSGPHREALPKLLDWCDEATAAHWTQETPKLLEWQETWERMIADGKVSKVNHPSANHATKQFPKPKVGRLTRTIRPRA